MEKFKREYKLTSESDTFSGFGLGFVVGNTQPKKKYKTAYWSAEIVITCFRFQINLMYNYKP